jgi:hypothetical protein
MCTPPIILLEGVGDHIKEETDSPFNYKYVIALTGSLFRSWSILHTTCRLTRVCARFERLLLLFLLLPLGT